LLSFQPGDLNVLVLPEMAFTGVFDDCHCMMARTIVSFIRVLGYIFRSPAEIEPYLEDEETGRTVTWAKEQGMLAQCFMAPGKAWLKFWFDCSRAAALLRGRRLSSEKSIF
jgi:protein N-terminal amidase